MSVAFYLWIGALAIAFGLIVAVIAYRSLDE
jgi:hypothetical protein